MIDSGKLLRRAVSDNPAIFKEDYAGGEQERFAKIVGNENDGFAETAREGAEFALKFRAGHGIKSTERLVHQENGRVGRKSASDPDALALAAREFARPATAVLCRFKTDKRKELVDASNRASGIPFFEGGDKRDVLGNGEMGEKTSVLNYIADAPAQSDGVPIGRGAATDDYSAGGRNKQPIDQPKERGFAAPTATEQDEGLAGRDGEANVINNAAAGIIVDSVGDTFKLNDRV
jgi:hypothetical protein